MITINPENPTSDDNVELTVYIGCPSGEISKSIVDSQFIIDASVNVGPGEPIPPCMATSPAPSPFVWSVGRLQPGEYQAVFYYDVQEQETEAFSVSQGQLPFPTPSLPTLGIPAAILLVVAVGWLANTYEAPVSQQAQQGPAGKG